MRWYWTSNEIHVQYMVCVKEVAYMQHFSTQPGRKWLCSGYEVQNVVFLLLTGKWLLLSLHKLLSAREDTIYPVRFQKNNRLWQQ